MNHSNPRRIGFTALSALIGVPGRLSPLLGAPVEGHPHHEPRKKIRRSLRASTVEGMFAEVITVCAGGAVVTGWALYLGCSPLVVGMLAALPYLSQFAQPFAAWLGSRVGHRKLAISSIFISRQLLWPLTLVPFVSWSAELKQALLFGIASVSAILSVVGNNAWVSWMGDLVPHAIRGRFFGRRTALCTLGNTLAALAAGVFLDLSHPDTTTGYVLAGLAMTAALAGLVTSYLMTLQHDPARPGEHTPAPVLKEALAPLLRPETHRVLTYQVAWNASVGLAAGYFNFHMLQNLKMGFTLMGLYTATVALSRIAVLPLWGKALDRVGIKPVLIVCSFGISLLPLVWLFPTESFLWPIAVDAVLAGVLWGGQNLATFALPLAFAPRNGRSYYLAAFAAAGGLSYTLATAIGGIVVQASNGFTLGSHTFGGIHLVFVLSASTRVLAALLSLRLVEARAQPLSALSEIFTSHARELVTRQLLLKALVPVRATTRGLWLEHDARRSGRDRLKRP
ncbi:MAG: MFS transporter [Myxococcaceae bacterium]